MFQTVGVFFYHPSEKYESIGMIIATQNFWENKTWQPNHQADMVVSQVVGGTPPVSLSSYRRMGFSLRTKPSSELGVPP